jgi:hypothetical protein
MTRARISTYESKDSESGSYESFRDGIIEPPDGSSYALEISEFRPLSSFELSELSFNQQITDPVEFREFVGVTIVIT